MSKPIDSTPSSSPIDVSAEEKHILSLVSLEDTHSSANHLKAHKLKVKSTGNPYLLAHLLSHLGHLQTLQGNYEEARETLNEADFVLIEAAKRDSHESPHRHRAWIRYMLERGRFFSMTGWEDSARSITQSSMEMARDTGHFDLFQESVRVCKELGILDSIGD